MARPSRGCPDLSKSSPGYVEQDPSGRYGRFREVLGKGAMKTVYKAFDEVMGMEVAWNQVKLADVFHSPVELQRLYSEVHLLKDLDHPSIMKFHSSWADPTRRTFNFITELFTSGTLREYRLKYPRVSIGAVKNWARQILNGLAYLHSHDPPVIHRDLKCDNIFVNGHLAQIKIGDLGLATILRGSHHAHSVIGTPEFMAPELYEEDYDELVDIYSFGMCVLEMLTSEYPYSECTNPAQIYKKVTLGKLPEAFYRIRDDKAREFVGRCLGTAPNRLPAKELLLDPFLAPDDGEKLLPLQRVLSQKSSTARMLIDEDVPPVIPAKPTRNTNMTITGTMNSDDDMIYLKVQISDKDGHARNIFFPFDMVNDTTTAVATEMVRELDITEWDPAEIAGMIEEEIASLVPAWKKKSSPFDYDRQESFDCDEDDEEEGAVGHPFYASSSSHSSSQVSLPALIDRNLINDDTASQCSANSFKYSNFNYLSGNEFEDHSVSATRFCPEQNRQITLSHRHHCASRSMVDIRSQLLHKSLVEEIENRRRMFKTVGAVESIGFQEPRGSSLGISLNKDKQHFNRRNR